MHLSIPLAALMLLSLVRPGFASTPRVEDVCIGNGTSGPYQLAWNHIQPGTETVQINGLAQLRGLDYSLDADGGTVTFARSLPAQSAAEVTYTTDAAAGRNSAGQTIPLSVDLLRGERGFLSFNALGKPGDSDRSDLTLGVGLGLMGGPNTQLTTRFFYLPVTASAETADDAAAKRMGLSVAGSAGAGGWGLFSFGFARAGVSLGDTGDDSLHAGQQTLTLGSRLILSRQAKAQFDYTQSNPTDGTETGAAAKTSLALTFTPSDKTQVQAGLAQSATEGSGTTQTLDLSAAAHPSDKMQVNVAYNDLNAPGTNNDRQALSLKTVLTPARTLSLETTAAQTRLGADTTDQQGVGLSLTPHPTLQLQAGLALRQKTTDGSGPLDTAVASVSGTVRPASFLEVSGSYRNRMAPERDADSADLLDTSAARVALSPLRSVHLVGTYAQNPDDNGDTLQRLAKRGIGLETSLGALGLSGGYDWSRRYDALDVEQTVHADLGLRFSAATQLTVGFQSRQNALAAAPPATAYTVAFTHNLGDRFNLSLNGKRQTTDAAPPDYNATANLGMKF